MNAQNYPIIDIERLRVLSDENYLTREPFPHLVLDDAFRDQDLDRIIGEFDNAEGSWRKFSTEYENKAQKNNEKNLGPFTRNFIHCLNSGPFLELLKDITGIGGLIPDPYLVGGGLHKIQRGGKLGIHVDFNKHKKMRVYRRLNIIIYLNRNWKEQYGGHLELWDYKKYECVKKILPAFNRMIIFSTTSKSFHGHPHPLECPEDGCRMSLALYYYTAEESGDQRSYAHSTLFLDKNKEVKSIDKGGLFNRINELICKKIGTKK